VQRSAPCLSPLLWCAFSFLPPLVCFQFVVNWSVFFFFCSGGGISLPRGYAGLSQGWLGEYCVMLVLTCLVCWISPKQVWGWCLVVVVSLLFSQCSVAWRRFLQARGSWSWSFDSPCCFISTKCGSSISARFLIHRAHIVWFCALVAILDPHPNFFVNSQILNILGFAIHMMSVSCAQLYYCIEKAAIGSSKQIGVAM
jgi:hypothetical protein